MENAIVKITGSEGGARGIISEEGEHQVTVRNANGRSSSTTFRIDKTPPTCSTVTYSPPSWTTGSVTATVRCSDTLSGCKNNVTSQTYSTEGTYSIQIEDHATNVANCLVTIDKIDTVAPTCGGNVTMVDIDGTTLNTGDWTNDRITVEKDCLDDDSGCISPGYVWLFADENGTITFNFEDNAGNTTACDLEITNIEREAPTCTTSLITDINAQGWSKEDVITEAQCFDTGGSGCSSGQALTGTIAEHNTNHTFTVTDNAGNSNTCSTSTVKIDRNKPVCSFESTGWVVLPETVTPDCDDNSVQTASNGISGCKTAQNFNVDEIDDAANIKVEDQADNISFCNKNDLKVRYVEIRGTQSTNSNPALKQELANIIKQNVADDTRNESPNSDQSTLNYNLSSGNIAYYENDVELDSFTVNDKKTIVVKGGDLYLKGNINYGTPDSILGIIVLKDSEGNKGNVFVDNAATDISAILFAEGSMLSVNGNKNPVIFSRDNTLDNQLYWKGSVITDNTIGGNAKNECPKQGCIYGTSTLENDLIYFRSYHYSGNGVASSDPQGSGAPMIIEYDSKVQQNTPYGFEVPSDFSFEEVVN